RAQMNPHFIFNSLNSIKSLINKNENDKAADYLTTFSKLIRTLFQNSDKREVSLHDELETCKLYTQIEKMRFGDKLDFVFEVDKAIDLKDIKVPALILQPFIENAIWHGLVPQESGGKVVFSVKEKNEAVVCTIDDDGIGRELSKQYKAQYEATHQSKGIGLTQSRLELDKLLNDREDTIEIIDKQNEDGTPGGTTIIITFKENGI
ncbi:MAG: sensor histidine kinase, partial [Chitinophagaceae bacterium]